MSALPGDDPAFVQVDYRLIEAMQECELALAHAQRLALVGSWDWSIATKAVKWSEEMRRIFELGDGQSEPTMAAVLETLHPDDRQLFDDAVASASRTLAAFTLRHRITRPSGEVRHVETVGEVVTDAAGAAATIHNTVRDRTEAVLALQHFHDISNALEPVQVAQEIEHTSAAVLPEEAQPHDPLTGLPTRRNFFDQTERALARVGSTGSIAVFSIDLDRFRFVNEDHGYERGDEVLVAVAERLRTSLRQYDTVARSPAAITRVGGDEFLLMCERVNDEAAAAAIATRVLRAIALPIALDSGQVVLTARVGIAMGTADTEAQQMILDAEAAQRHAKELGGARYQLFAIEHRERTPSVSALIEELRHAVSADEFHLVYQPKISLATNRLVGVEALLRWHRPTGGVVMPEEFMPAAEMSGVIVAIGEWVLRESCRQAAAWHQAYPKTHLQVAVNVSARQFRTGLSHTIIAAVAEAGISSSAVCLEMTETTIMDDIDGTVGILDELKDLGFTVSIDDFGTGYSSLEYLHRLPINEVKIDRSFVAGLGTDAVNTAIVASVISLAHAMNLEVVAEGVETLDQLERLRSLGCDFAQGYYIAPPAAPIEIDGYLAADIAGQVLPPAGATGVALRPSVTETVLVVDDAADVRMLVKMSLTAAGFTVEEAGDGAAALALAGRLTPDCVLLDVNMPDMSGIEVCRALRDDPITAGCTIVMLTGQASAADKAEAFLVGADDYIVKPFAPRDLVARVRTAVRRRQTRIDLSEEALVQSDWTGPDRRSHPGS